MTAVKASDVSRFLAKPDPKQPVVLIYGSDAGLVRERVEQLLQTSVDDPADPFSLVRLESEELGANPARLADEVNTIPMFGGRRAVLLRINSRHNILPSIEAVLDAPAQDCRTVIEAGELRKNAPLRTLCEKSKNAAVIACYQDRAQDLARLIEEESRDAGTTLSPDARSALMELLGGDRLASRGEIRKLMLYARGRQRVELEDVRAVVSDASELGLDNVVDAAFAGKTADLEREFNKARGDGSSPAAIVSAALRHVAQLHRMRLAIDAGGSAEDAMRRSGPPVHFSRQDTVGSALKTWSAARLQRALEQLAEASLETRRQPGLAEVIAARTLLSLAIGARRKGA